MFNLESLTPNFLSTSFLMKPALIIGIVIGIILVYIFDKMSNRCWISSDAHEMKTKAIKALVRQAARWSTAAEQDENAMIAVLHANYGAAYLWAVSDVATSSEIEKATGINYNAFMSKIVDVQDKATRKMIDLCPYYAPPESMLTRIAGEA